MSDRELVLVTGGSGFLGAHVIAQLLHDGYAVRTTVRRREREPDVRAMMEAAGADDASLSFAVADLDSDAGWAGAVAGADRVLHVASPFPAVQPTDAQELIRPARDGALRVLRAARDAGVRRVVLTSSFAAVGYGGQRPGRPFDEGDWTDVRAPGLTPYVRSKAIAERAAWDFVEQEGGALELAVINPVGIFGPVLGPDYSSSMGIIRAMMTGSMSAVPDVGTSIVDVRDVASLHVRAMTEPRAAGERFLAVAGEPTSFPEMARVLRQHFGDSVPTISRHVMPNWVVRAGGIVSRRLREIAPRLGQADQISHAKATSMLHWEPRTVEETIITSGQSLIDAGLVTTGEARADRRRRERVRAGSSSGGQTARDRDAQ